MVEPNNVRKAAGMPRHHGEYLAGQENTADAMERAQRVLNHANVISAESLRKLEAGLLDHGNDGYTVTASGADLLKRLNDVQAFATRWVAGRAKKQA